MYTTGLWFNRSKVCCGRRAKYRQQNAAGIVDSGHELWSLLGRSRVAHKGESETRVKAKLSGKNPDPLQTKFRIGVEIVSLFPREVVQLMDGLSLFAVRILGADRLVQNCAASIGLLPAKFTRYQMRATLRHMDAPVSSGEQVTALRAGLLVGLATSWCDQLASA